MRHHALSASGSPHRMRLSSCGSPDVWRERATCKLPAECGRDPAGLQRHLPQIVRISYVEGDVRVSRGKHGATWEAAETGLPLQTGFNLVTGTGRAEIEFEDASTLYLADNSALAFNDLRTTGGVPHTQVALLAGTATLHVHATIAGELFSFDTPAHRIPRDLPQSLLRTREQLPGCDGSDTSEKPGPRGG